LNNMEALVKYQEAELKYDKLEAKLRNTPASKRFSKVRQFLEDQKRILRRMMAAVESRRSAIAATSQRFDLYEKRYEDGIAKFEKSKKEDPDELAKFSQYFEQLTARIAQERREFARLVHALEKEEAQLSDMRIKIAKARKEYDELKATVEKERAEAQESLQAAKAAADALAKNVDPQLLEAYRQVRRNHALAVVEVVGNKCSGCNMELPAVADRRLREQELVECDNCGRILYISN
jgi:predicted  nucleic acid-binding Zn-ribbon protein